MFLNIAIAAFVATSPVPDYCVNEAAPAIVAKYEAGEMTKAEALVNWENCIFLESTSSNYTES